MYVCEYYMCVCVSEIFYLYIDINNSFSNISLSGYARFDHLVTVSYFVS